MSSYADSVDHQYEALYDIINQSSIVADVSNIDHSDDTIPKLPERDHSPLPKIKNKTVSKDSGLGEYKSNTMDGCLNDDSIGDSAGATKGGDDRIHRIKRNWSLTKSDIRLELISRWNRIKPKKASRSAAEIGSTQCESKSVENEKKNLEIKLIPNQPTKLTYSSPLISPSSPTQETAQFYLKYSDMEDSAQSKGERPKSESFTLDCSTTNTRKNPHPRRVSLKSVSRPTVPPPKPPMEQSMFYVSSCRSSTASSSTNSESKSTYDVIWANSDANGCDANNSYLLKSSSESCVPIANTRKSEYWFIDLILCIFLNFIIYITNSNKLIYILCVFFNI